jgi:hypothetical protein
MSKWCTFSEEEYRDLALQMPEHKDHAELKENIRRSHLP